MKAYLFGFALLLGCVGFAQAEDSPYEVTQPIDGFGLAGDYDVSAGINETWLSFMLSRFSVSTEDHTAVSLLIEHVLFETQSYDDTYWVFLMAEYSNRDPMTVLGLYQRNPKRGWGYVAKVLSIKPGSSTFHQLKERKTLSMVPGSQSNNGKSSDDRGDKGKSNNR